MARKPKLSKQEKIERDIRLNLRKQERAVEMQAKAAKMLRSSAIALAQLHKRQRKLEAKTANDLVTTQVESPTKTFVRETVAAMNKEPPTEETVAAVADKVDKALPKRHRKPKPTENGGAPEPMKADETEKRMKALGFRKTGKRKVAAPAEKQ